MRRGAFREPKIELAPAAAPSGRPPPHNLDVEASLLEAVMSAPGAFEAVNGTVTPASFYAPANRRIFSACCELRARGEPVDVNTVGEWLRARGLLADVGGVPYLTFLVNETPTVADLPAAARIVADLAAMRAFIARCQRVAADGYGDVGDARAFMGEAVEALRAIELGGVKRRSVSYGEAVKEGLAQIKAGEARGQATGYVDFDRLVGGLYRGELGVIAGRPGMGKTAWAVGALLGAAYDTSGREQCGSLLFTFEMRRAVVALRALCAEANVPLNDLRRGRFDPDGPDERDPRAPGPWGRLNEHASAAQHLPVYLQDQPTTVEAIWAEARAMRDELARGPACPVTGRPRRLGVVALDYLQLVEPPDGRDSREQEVAHVSRQLKKMALDLDCPVVALAQLNRAVEARADKRPKMSDLRESGAIEQDADLIAFLYRDEYYNPGGEIDHPTEEGRRIPNAGVAEVLVEKCRNGATGVVAQSFNGPAMRFGSFEDRPPPEYAAG